MSTQGGRRLRRRGAVATGTAALAALASEGGATRSPSTADAPVAGFLCRLPSFGALAAPSTARAQSAGDPSVVGQWSALQNWPIRPVHAHVLPTGRVLAWSSYSVADTPRLYNPSGGGFTNVPQAGMNLFCSGHALLADGRVFAVGGHGDGDGGNPIGINGGRVFNHSSNTWATLPAMHGARWYPTVTTLPSGEMLVLSGTTETGVDWNPLVQVWQPASQSWRDLWGAYPGDAGWYPHMYVAPQGWVFLAGPLQETWGLDTNGGGQWWSVAWSGWDGGWSGFSSVMYEPGKVLRVGGGYVDAYPTAQAEVIDLTAPGPQWRPVAPLAIPRRQHDTTLLPDGTVLVTHGHWGAGQDDPSAPIYTAERWDPATEQWTTLADSSPVYRGYHSLALLLPDGRVLTGGSEQATNEGRNAELFSPPYLFKGARPTISAAPAGVGYGQSFAVGTPDAGTASGITQVTLLGLGSVTHSFGFNQRFLRLPFTVAGSTLNVTAPATANLAPPGHYMLFILNGNGVPSVARILQVSATAPGPTPTTATAPSPTPTTAPSPTPTPRKKQAR